MENEKNKKNGTGSPAISIIIPVYRTEAYLNRCVRSVLTQTFDDLELILIDDGSPDGCPGLCDAWAEKDSRVRVIHQENKGAAAARNRGLDAASGRYIGFVDSDDWIEKDMYRQLYRAVTGRQADMAVCEVRMEAGHGKNDRKGNGSLRFNSLMKAENRAEDWDRSALLDRFFRVHGEADRHGIWNCLICADRLREYRFPEGKMNEDIDLSYYLALNCCRAVYLPVRFYHYCRNPDGVTNSRFSMRKMDLLDVWDGIAERVPRDAPEYMRACEMNRARAGFTLLARMRLFGYDHGDPEMRGAEKRLKAETRAAYRDLMRWKMPVSRKILLTLLVL